ncbi:hypothetical protein ACFDDA_01990 [Escherichia coli]
MVFETVKTLTSSFATPAVSFSPLGADIRQDDSGISVGMVGEEGHAWLSGVAENQCGLG